MNRLAIFVAAVLAAPYLHAQTVTDQGTSGIQDDGSLTGAASLTADAVYGSAAVAVPAGAANRVQLTQPVTDLDMSAGYTYMTWFKQTTPGGKGLIGLGACCTATDGDARNGYTLNLRFSDTLRYWGGSSSNDANHNLLYSNTAIDDGNWHHAAVRVQPGQVDMFFDGALVASNAESNIPTQPSLASSSSSLSENVPHVGGDGISAGADAAVVIDEVRVYGSLLTDQQIVDAMNNAGPLPDRLYYPFDDDTVAGELDPRATFQVSKDFDDDNTASVEVTISCNTGLPLEQTTEIEEGDGVNFVVVDFNSGEMDCEITEVVPDGYNVTYEFSQTSNGTGCVFEGVAHGDGFFCDINNDLDQVVVDVTKVWIDENPQFNAQNVAGASWSCSNVAFPCDQGIANGCDSGNLDFFGNPGEDSFFVFPDWESGTTCSITEVDLLESGIEVDDSECQGLVVFPGTGASCTIFNTRLFEGIPTLSQYGLGLLALLILGVGLIGFRRFV